MCNIADWLEQRAAFWAEEGRKLAADDRGDEYSLTKVRVNVYGICKTMLETLGMERGEAQLARLQSTWEQFLETARLHGDAGKVLIEEIKLETIREVREKLKEG